MAVSYNSRSDYAKMTASVKETYLKRFDTNKDGALSRDEAKVDYDEKPTSYYDTSEYFDGNDLVQRSNPREFQRQIVIEDTFTSSDANKDGKLSAEEIADQYYRTRLDADGDGQLGLLTRLFKEDKGSFAGWVREKLFPVSTEVKYDEKRTPFTASEKMLYEQNKELQRRQQADDNRREMRNIQKGTEVGIDIGGAILGSIFGSN